MARSRVAGELTLVAMPTTQADGGVNVGSLGQGNQGSADPVAASDTSCLGIRRATTPDWSLPCRLEYTHELWSTKDRLDDWESRPAPINRAVQAVQSAG